MIDIHNHLLYGVDDGSKSIELSIEVLKDLVQAGITDIILTPHYIPYSNYSNPRSDNLERLEKLKREAQRNNISINLYLGNEIFIDDSIYDLLEKNVISSLNNTNYILVELPMSGEFSGYQEIFKFLMNKGYKIVLAHPERYITFQDDYSKAVELDEMGVYFQSNLDSLVGKYGPRAEALVKRLLKDNRISFLSTDIHQKKHDYDKWKEAKKIALEYVTEDVYNTLVKGNPSMLIY